MRQGLTVIILCVAITAGTAPGFAQDDASADVIASLSVATDLRDRGVSLTDKDFGVEASVDIAFGDGIFSGAQAQWVDTPFGGDARLSPYVGYEVFAGGYDIAFGTGADILIGGDDDVFPSAFASISRDFGLLIPRLRVEYAFDGRWITPDSNSLYADFQVLIPVPTQPDWTLALHAGHDIREGRRDVTDWSVGVIWYFGIGEIEAQLVDSSLDGQPDARLGSTGGLLKLSLLF